MNPEQIAKVCHATNKEYCHTIGDDSQKSWDEADQWQRDSAVAGVNFALSHIGSSPEDQHNSWLIDKKNNGWVYGPVKDTEKKEHPCIVPYAELPLEQRIKDYLFKAIVQAFVGADKE
jgi:hypothetical protein